MERKTERKEKERAEQAVVLSKEEEKKKHANDGRRMFHGLNSA